MNQLLDFLSADYQHIINPFQLEKLTYYLKYNYLYTTENIINQLMQIDGFRLGQVMQFVKKVDEKAFDILLYAKYLHVDFVPIDLLISLLSKKKFEIQNSIRFLLDLDLVELLDSGGGGQLDKGLKISRLVVDQIKPASNDLKYYMETKLAECLNLFFNKNDKIIYYPSVISFLAESRNLCPSLDQDVEFGRKFAELCYLVGEYNTSNARFDTSIKFIELGLERLNRTKESPSKSLLVDDKFYNLLGMCHFNLLNYRKALDCFISISSDSKLPRPQFIIGKCYFETGNFSDAIKNLRKWFDSSTNQDETLRYECTNMLALSYQKLEKYSSANKYNLILADMIKSKPRVYKKINLVDIYIRVGTSMECMDDCKNSLLYFERAFDIASKTTNFKLISWLFMKMGQNNLTLENFNQAFSDFRSAHELGENKPGFSLIEIAEPLDWTGVCHRCRGDYKLALKYFDQSFRLKSRFYQEVTDNSDMVKSYIYLGLANRDLGDVVKCEEYFSKAYRIKKELLKNEIDETKLSRIEKWSKHKTQEYVLENCSSDSLLKQHLYDCDGKQMARAYVFGIGELDFVREVLQKEHEKFSRQECNEFIRWFDQISLADSSKPNK